VSNLLSGNSYLLEILQRDKYPLHMKRAAASSNHIDLASARRERNRRDLAGGVPARR